MRTKMKKWGARLFAAALAGAITTAGMTIPSAASTSSVSDNDTESYSSNESNSRDAYSSATSTSSYILPASTWITPEAKHGEYVYVALPIVNMFKYNVKDVVITPVVSTVTKEWPFEIEASGYTQKVDCLVGEEACPNVADRVKNVVWAFKVRDDVLNGYYKIDYNILYTNPACVVESCTISTFVKTIGKPGAGSTSGSEDENAKKSTPRVIVSGFTTEPAEVYAGDTFTLNMKIQNTSKTTAVSNLEFNMEAVVEGKDDNTYSAFLPTSGSNTIYVDSIGAGAATDISIGLTAKADLVQKPYAMKIKMDYEDTQCNPYTGESSVSIPIKQISKFDTSSAEVEPASIEVGAQSNVMFSIYNTGKTKLYNVSVRFEGDSITGGDAFVGPLESGATGNIDVMLTGAAPSMDEEGLIKAYITYENESGVVTETEKDINLYVTEPMMEDFSGDMELEEEPTGNPLLKWILCAVVIGVLAIAAVTIVLVLKNKKKKARLAELEELEELKELDEQEETRGE